MFVKNRVRIFHLPHMGGRILPYFSGIIGIDYDMTFLSQLGTDLAEAPGDRWVTHAVAPCMIS